MQYKCIILILISELKEAIVMSNLLFEINNSISKSVTNSFKAINFSLVNLSREITDVSSNFAISGNKRDKISYKIYTTTNNALVNDWVKIKKDNQMIGQDIRKAISNYHD